VQPLLINMAMPYRTPIDLKVYSKVGKHVRRLHINFQPDPTVGLRIITIVVKLDSYAFYVRIRIWLFFYYPDCIIPCLLNMIHPRIINRDKRQSFSLLLKPLKFFSCQQSSPTTLDEGSSPSLSSIIITMFSLLSFWSLLGFD